MTTKQILTTGAIALGLTGSGTAYYFNRGLDTPAAPTNLRKVTGYATSITVAWNPVAEATSYEVWVTDSAQAGDQPQKASVTAATYTVTNLLPAHTYRIKVYSVLDAVSAHLLSTSAVEKNTSTEYVIGEDIVQCPPKLGQPDTLCPLTCSTIPVDSPNIVRWGTLGVRDYHKIRIRAKTGGTLLAQAVLERDRVNGVLHIRNFTTLSCDNTPQIVNYPSAKGGPVGTPPLTFYGSFPQNGEKVAYRIEADIDKCVVQLIPPASMANYIIEAERCISPLIR